MTATPIPGALRQRGAPRPDVLSPMLLETCEAPFDDPAWLFETKFDGHRLLASAHRDGVRLRTREGLWVTPWFPEIVGLLRPLAAHGWVLDGEVCVLDADGRSSFERLNRRLLQPLTARSEPVVYCVFDVLMANGRRITEQTLRTRRAHLDRVRGLPGVHVVEAVVGEGTALYEQAVGRKLEGIVAKRLASRYLPGDRSVDWLKIKVPKPSIAERFKRFPTVSA